MIIVCTMTPDFKTPSVASLVQAKLGIKNTGAIDLNAACAGFTYGLNYSKWIDNIRFKQKNSCYCWEN